jgi:hypothetical protein
MKNIILGLIVPTVLFLGACKEEPVVIPPLKVGEQKVLVEEFTGVKCVNCPDGAAEIENLKVKYKENLIPVSIHAGFFAKKLPESKIDFKISQGVNILGLLGEPEGYPAVVINRKALGDNGKLVVIGQSKWAGLIANELNQEPKVLLDVQNTYDAQTRELQVVVNISANQDINVPKRLSIMVAENNIEDAQIVPSKGTITNYKHNHVLRDMLTNFDGLEITESLNRGTTLQKKFTYKIPSNFKAKDCEIIAFLHKVEGGKEVFQATSKKVQ